MNCIRCTYCGTCLTAVVVFRLDALKEESCSVQMLEGRICYHYNFCSEMTCI